VGFLVGALTFSALGDRFGRKRMLIIATAIFAACTSGPLRWHVRCSARVAPSDGARIGRSDPNSSVLASEFSPPAQRPRVVTIMWAAVPFGGMVGSFASAAIIPRFRLAGHILHRLRRAVILIPVLMSVMPESAEIELGARSGTERAKAGASIAVAELFTGRTHAVHTSVVGASFMTWMTLVVVAFWTPPCCRKRNVGTRRGLRTGFNNAGGVVGTVLIGVILGWIRPHSVLITAFLVSAVLIAAMGMTIGYFPGLAIAAVSPASFFRCRRGLIAVAAGGVSGRRARTGVGWALGLVGSARYRPLGAASWLHKHGKCRAFI